VLYNQKTLEAVAVATQDAALALETVSRDIRNAGFGTDTVAQPVIAAGADFLELGADHNSDGDIDDAYEHLRYAYRPDRRQMTRASGRGNPQPFTDDVAPGGLRCSYRDERADEIPLGLTGVDQADLPRIRLIDVQLALQLPNPDPRVTVPILITAATAVALRNR
jgi:hypothetical protein